MITKYYILNPRLKIVKADVVVVDLGCCCGFMAGGTRKSNKKLHFALSPNFLLVGIIFPLWL